MSINSNEVQPCLGAPGPRSGSERVVLSFPADRGLTELSGGVIEPTCGPRWGAAQVPGLDPSEILPDLNRAAGGRFSPSAGRRGCGGRAQPVPAHPDCRHRQSDWPPPSLVFRDRAETLQAACNHSLQSIVQKKLVIRDGPGEGCRHLLLHLTARRFPALSTSLQSSPA